MCDHYRTNGIQGWGATRFFVKPPKLPEKEDIEVFAESLTETIEQKLRELLARFDEVDQRHREQLELINHQVLNQGMDDMSEYFWTMLAECGYAESDYIRQWIKYWLQIYEIVSETYVLPYLSETELAELGVTPEQIEQAKQVPIETLLEEEPRHMGNRLLVCCPFHGERTPSFTIFTDDNHFYCFGCHVGGDSIDFLMKKKNINLVEAVKELLRG